jgi:hypothetical protein
VIDDRNVVTEKITGAGAFVGVKVICPPPDDLLAGLIWEPFLKISHQHVLILTALRIHQSDLLNLVDAVLTGGFVFDVLLLATRLPFLKKVWRGQHRGYLDFLALLHRVF